MLKINKQTITLTKGDDASLRLVPRYKDRTEYVLTEGDSAVFRIKFGHTLVELDCTLNLETNKIVANITPNDTKDFNPGIYRYEAELITSFGFHYTFIADQTFILGQEYEQRITSTSNGNSSAVGGNLPEIDGIVDGEPVVYGDIQPTNPMMDYDELNHLPKLNDITIKGSHDNAYYGIPTKTSDLENDSDFVSDDDYVHTDNNYDDTAKNAVDALGTASTYDVPESGNASTSQVVKGDDSRLRDNRDPNPHTHSKADITDFPTNVSAFNNDSGFITNTVNNLANYYLKTETYTRAEVEQLIAAIKQGKFEIVAELPASGDANVIYLVPKSTAQTSNSYDEYVYINNAWEKIGDTDIDLSGYVTDDELTTALQSYLTTSAFNTAIANYYTKTEVGNLLDNKVDKVPGKGLSTNDYDNTAKGIVDGVTSALNDKVDKVQGKGLSTNDYDNTAKGIVDGVTSALADKVDKVNGKGLSTEDYTTAEKSKLGGISENAKKVASSSTNGHIEIDDVDTTVYDDTAVTTAIDNIEDELSTDYATVEGNPINFSTLSAQKSKSTILSLEPIQDLHGYDKPWVGGAGKNLLPLILADLKTINTSGTWTNNAYIIYGITYTVNTDADNNVTSIKVTGSQATGNANLFISNTLTDTLLNTNKLNGCPTDGGSSKYGIYCYTSTYTSIGNDFGSGATLSNAPSGSSNNLLFIQIANGFTIPTGGLTFYPMIRLSTETDATFQPYTNECGISGRTEIGILGCGKNLIRYPYPMQGSSIVKSDTSSGITWHILDDNSIFLEGNKTATANIRLNVYSTLSTSSKQDFIPYIGKEVILSGGASGGSASTYFLNFQGFVQDGIGIRNYGTDQNIVMSDITDFDTIQIVVAVQSGYTIPSGGLFFKPMIRLASDVDSNYLPYTESNDLTISLGQTVYGGTLDVENGVLVVDRGYVDLGDYNWVVEGTDLTGKHRYKCSEIPNIKPVADSYTIANLISNKYVAVTATNTYRRTAEGLAVTIDGKIYGYVEEYNEYTAEQFKTAMSGVQLVYELATPITINLTPHTINLLKGVNNISTDGDKITLTYRDGSVATLGDLTSAVDNLDSKIDESKILTDTATGDKYILVVTNGVLSVEQISN